MTRHERVVRGLRGRLGDQRGSSLIELLVSFSILAVALTAFAGLLVTALRTTNRNELDVNATAVGQQFTEELQAVNWDNAALYEDEIAIVSDDMVRWRARIDATAKTFEGAELLLAAGPANVRDGTSGQKDCDVLRNDTANSVSVADIPCPTSSITVANTTFNIDRYIVFIDRDGAGGLDTKKFVNIISWIDRFGDYREIRSEGERAPTIAESQPADDGLRILSFFVTPDPVDLDSSTGRPTRDVEVLIRTNNPVNNATLTYEHLDVVEEPISGTLVVTKVSTQVTLTATEQTTVNGYTGFTTFATTLDQSKTYFNGTSEFTFNATNAAPALGGTEATRTVTYRNGPHDEPGVAVIPDLLALLLPTAAPVSIKSVTKSAVTICIDNGSGTIDEDFVLSMTIEGFAVLLGVPDGAVDVSYDRRDAKNASVFSTKIEGARYVSVSGNDTNWTFTLDVGDGFWQDGDRVDMIIQARRVSDDGTAIDSSTTVTVHNKPC
ncbi:MAG: type II secretory pathway pseudopilin PulG [Glaciecola sp.]|jgi:type II secretory pathway pseudopilin PulG